MKQYDNKVVGENIKNLRKKNNIKQEELAEMLNMSRTNVSNYESGRVIPPANILFQLGELFSVPVDLILGRDYQVYFKEKQQLINALNSIELIIQKTKSEIKS